MKGRIPMSSRCYGKLTTPPFTINQSAMCAASAACLLVQHIFLLLDVTV